MRLTDIEGLWNTSRFDLPKLLNDPERPRRQPAGVHPRLLAPGAATSSTSSTSPRRSPGSTGPTCCTWWSSKFAEIDLHPDGCRTSRWATCTRSSIRALLGALERDGRRALHPTRGDPADGEPAVRRGRRPAAATPGIVKTLFDPACGTGGMLSVAEDHLRQLNPARPARGVRPGAQRTRRTPSAGRDMMLKGQDAREHRVGQLVLRRRPRGQTVRLPARQPAVRRGVEEGAGRRRGRAQDARLRRPLRGRAARDQRRQLPVPPAHDLEDEARRRRAARGSAIVFNGSPLFTGDAGVGRVRDPPVDHRERLARSGRRPARPALLQHRHLHLLLDRHQPQARRTAGARCS